MKDFNTGFTNKSYFHIIKSIVEGIYERNFDIRKFDFNFRDDSSINACADYDKQGNYDILKIITGTIIEIVALMKTAFAQRNILSNFGNANEEKNAIYTGEYVYRNNKHELIFRTQNTIVDSCREQLSFYVALMAIRFVFTHEVGHIVNGHTRLMNDLYMNSKIYMRMEKSNNIMQYCLDRRTLEMDADAAAATSSIDNILILYEQDKAGLEDMQIYSIENLLELWGFSIACVFLLFELNCRTNYDLKSYYLPNSARYILAIDAARQTLLSYKRNKVISYTIDVEMYDKAVTKGLIEAEKLFLLYSDDLTLSKDLFSNCEKFETFSKEVNENWDKNLRERLKKYSRTVLFSEEETEQAVIDMKIKEENILRRVIRQILKKVR